MRIGKRSSGHGSLIQLGITKKSVPIGKLVYDFFHSSVQSQASTSAVVSFGAAQALRSNTSLMRRSMDRRSELELKYRVRQVRPGLKPGFSHTPATPSSDNSPTTASLRSSGTSSVICFHMTLEPG